jgi:hypothetical protein
MNPTTRIVAPQRQRRGCTSNTLAISLAHSRRRARCDGVGMSGGAPSTGAGYSAPAQRCTVIEM